MLTRLHKQLLVIALGASVALLALSEDAAALTQSTNLAVGASVNMRCNVVTANLAFGNYMPAGNHATAPLDAVGSIGINCAAGGNNVRVLVGQGQYPATGSTNASPLRQMGFGANRLAYNLYQDVNRTQVWRSQLPGLNPSPSNTYPVNLPVYGRIPPAQNVPWGTYTDSVLVTVNF